MTPEMTATTYAIAAAVFARGGQAWQVDQVFMNLTSYVTPPLNGMDAAVRLDTALTAAGLPPRMPGQA